MRKYMPNNNMLHGKYYTCFVRGGFDFIWYKSLPLHYVAILLELLLRVVKTVCAERPTFLCPFCTQPPCHGLHTLHVPKIFWQLITGGDQFWNAIVDIHNGCGSPDQKIVQRYSLAQASGNTSGEKGGSSPSLNSTSCLSNMSDVKKGGKCGEIQQFFW